MEGEDETMVQCCMRGEDCGKRRRPRVIIMMGVIYEED